MQANSNSDEASILFKKQEGEQEKDNPQIVTYTNSNFDKATTILFKKQEKEEEQDKDNP